MAKLEARLLATAALWVQIQGCRIQRKTWCMGPFAVVYYNLALSRLQSRLQHIYHGQPYYRVDFILQLGLRIWPLRFLKNKKWAT